MRRHAPQFFPPLRVASMRSIVCAAFRQMSSLGDDDLGAAAKRPDLRLRRHFKEVMQDESLGNRFRRDEDAVIAQDRNPVGAQVAVEHVLHSGLELEAGEFMIRQAAMEQHRLLRDREEPVALGGNCHVGRRVGVEDGIHVRSAPRQSRMNDQGTAAERPFGAEKRPSVEVVFLQARRRHLAEHEVAGLDQDGIHFAGNPCRQVIIGEVADAEMIHQPIGRSEFPPALPFRVGNALPEFGCGLHRAIRSRR